MHRKSPLVVAALTAVATLAIAGGLAWMTGHLGPRPAPPVPAGDRAAAAGKERKVIYWRAPMNPLEIYDKPGKSKMGMDLVPVYEDEVAGGADVTVDPVMQQNMGIRTAVAEKGPLARTIRTYGHVTSDETRTAQVSPKISGWVEKLHVDFTGRIVKKGDPLFDIYSPELVTAQEEYRVALRSLAGMPGDSGRDLLQSARRRLEYWDIPDEEIRAIETTGKARKTLTIRSPFSGVVMMKNVVEGTFVKAGTTVYNIADLSRVWVEAHIYEYELPWVEKGQEARMTLPYEPGREYVGQVAYVYPYLQQKTRDVVVRLEFENPDLDLKPEMYADVRIINQGLGQGLLVPAEAVIRSGERNVVFVTRGDGKFSPREVTLGVTVGGGRVQVLTGLAPGEVVVTSGQFLLDSESKLKEAVQKMREPEKATPEKAKKPSADEDFFEDM
ncbi:MAG: efflux RND transporter periplasmic adaptor subunit [Thermodesulfobacteriota bacterium]